MADIQINRRAEELSAREIKDSIVTAAEAVAPVWRVATTQQKQGALNVLATWNISSHTPTENALYAGVVLCLIACAALWIKSFGRNG